MLELAWWYFTALESNVDFFLESTLSNFCLQLSVSAMHFEQLFRPCFLRGIEAFSLWAQCLATLSCYKGIVGLRRGVPLASTVLVRPLRPGFHR
jgi:hypothetical protein